MTGNKPQVKATVLIVDDTPGNLAMLSDLLFAEGFRVLVATDGESALEQIDALKPDIILLDVMMPGINGFETCRRLKNQSATMSIPVIFMTGLSELDKLLQGFGEGAVDYIVKPFHPTEVLARVRAHTAQARHLQRAQTALNDVVFALLAFDSSGLITWLTPSAVEVLEQSYAEFDNSVHNLSIGACLPNSLHWLKARASASGTAHQTFSIGNDFSGRLLPSRNQDEYLLLMQQVSRHWNLGVLKTAYGLTAREAEILTWIAKGKTNKEVGLILATSPRTVNKHLEHIFEKLGVPTRTAAVAKVLDSG
ncbi:MAG: DNA-binding response regulator [Gammaproteobacteria bacterium HGW-Gammaproteobacteria-3]|nr:MAG: DNA-binding response regulator [Gammaproteobacteria bacterium HGW-Gammaproteobacteria-3]